MGLYCKDAVFPKVYSSSDMDMDTLLLLVYTTPQLSIALLCTMTATPQSLDVLLWFVYMSLQFVIDQLLSTVCHQSAVVIDQWFLL
jgi:hypothetical protein